MRLCRSIPFICVPEFAIVIGAAGALLSGCSPDQVQAPREVPAVPTGIEAAVVPITGLVGEWKLDEVSGTTAADTKNGFNAAVLGGAAFVAGKLGNALNLNNGTAGTGGKYAEMPSNATLDNVQEGDYTISSWFFSYSVPPDASADNRNWAIVVKPGQHTGLTYDNTQTFSARHYLTGLVQVVATSAATYPLNAWNHVASVVSKSAGTVKIYVNGALQGTTTFAANTPALEYNATTFRIGKARTTWAADGKVDQVRIYNRALSAAEITDLFNETATPPPTGITYSLWGLNPPAPNGGVAWTGGVKTTKSSAVMLGLLQGSQNPRYVWWFGMTGGDEKAYAKKTQPDSGSFLLQDWKDSLDKFMGGTIQPDGKSGLYSQFSPYINNGTFQGIVLLDDLAGFKPPVPANDIDSMAAFAKRRFPGLLTSVRYRAVQLQDALPPGGAYTKLDMAWGQYHNRIFQGHLALGTPTVFRDSEVTAAQDMHLGLMLGINASMGYNDSTHSDTDVPADSLLSWGTALIGSNYVCGLSLWDSTYAFVADANVKTLATRVKNHVAAPCDVP